MKQDYKVLFVEDEDIVRENYMSILNNMFTEVYEAKDGQVAYNIYNPQIIINIKTTKENYIIEICDNGGGIKEKILEKIFEPYYSTKHKSQGTGLGLYISKMIIQESMQSQLSVHNTKEGACFTILLKIIKK